MRKPFYIVSENFINQLEYDANDFRVKKIDNLFCEENERSSMVKDRNKGIESISYNHLNLPTKITWANEKYISYIYNAAGQKISKSVRENDSIKIVAYLDGFQYAGKVLQFFPHAEGYVKVTALSAGRGLPTSDFAFNYVFNYTDHLGNVRLSYTKDPQTGTLDILDEDHYYPFGLKHGVYAAGNLKDFTLNGAIDTPILEQVRKTEYNYKYNGMELQDELGLNMYAMDMRHYDPAIARWVVQDPVTHFDFSPYNAFDNNPVFWADPSGADAINIGYDRVVDSDSYSGSATWSGGGEIDVGGGNTDEANTNQNNSSAQSNTNSAQKLDNGDPEKPKLENTSTNPDHVIYFKPEGDMVVEGKEYKNGGAYPLKPGEIWEHGFDGVAAPHISKGSIFKASNGVSVTVSEKNITWSGGNIGSKVAMLAGNIASMSNKTGGWKTGDWLNKHSAHTVTTNNYSWKTGEKMSTSTTGVRDKSWVSLFDKSGLRNAQDYKQSHTFYINNYGW